MCTLRSIDGLENERDMGSVAKRTSSAKWKARDLQLQELLREFVCQTEGQGISIITEELINGVFQRLRRFFQMDKQGVSLSMLYMIYNTDASAFTLWVNRCLASTKSMEDLCAFGTVFGKRSAKSTSNELRAIVPMSSILRLLDRILFACAEPSISLL